MPEQWEWGIEPEWDKTLLLKDRVKDSPFYEESGPGQEKGMFKGRTVIGRDMDINGGVYLGASQREAIVVDDKKDPELNEVFTKLLKRRIDAVKSENDGEYDPNLFGQNILKEVWEFVNEVMPFDKDKVNDIIAGLSKPDEKIYLSVYLGGGVCRHQALLTTYLLQRLKIEGWIRGTTSIDRNFVPNMGGHAWTRYTNSTGVVFILDSAQNYFGRLDRMDDGKKDNSYRWFYERPEDRGNESAPGGNGRLGKFGDAVNELFSGN